MITHDNEPNFTINLTGGCNAKCPFCFMADTPKEDAKSEDYLRRLDKILSRLPKQFKSISISGMEPMMSPVLDDVLLLLKRYKRYTKIVLTTNGSLLDANRIAGVVTNVNISRHHQDEYINRDIFGGSYSMSNLELKNRIKELELVGIPVRINCVIDDSTNEFDVVKMIELSRDVYAEAINFRRVAGCLDPTQVETIFTAWGEISSGGCEFCSSKVQRINGQYVIWSKRVIDPGSDSKKIFELVYQPNANLYSDWGYKNNILITSLRNSDDRTTYTKRYPSGSRFTGGCGGGCRPLSMFIGGCGRGGC